MEPTTAPKHDEPDLTEKAGTAIFSRLVGTLVDLLTMITLVRLLTKGDVAVIGFVLLIYQTARSFATFGFPESIFYYFEKLSPQHRRGVALQTISVLSVLGFIAGGVMLGFAEAAPAVLSQWEGPSLKLVQELLPWLALVAVLEIPTWPTNNILLALDRQRAAAAFQLFVSITSFAALVLPIALGYGIDIAVYALVCQSILRVIITVIVVQTVLPGPSARLPEGFLRQQIGFAFPLGINAVTARLNKQVDKFVVSLLLPAAVFADYQVGGQEIPLVTAIPYGAASVFISRYASLQLSGDRPALLDLWLRGVMGVSLIVVPVACVFMMIAHDFITLVFGAEYVAAVVPFQIYTIILLHRVAHYGSMLQAFADTKTVLRYTLMIVACNAALSIPLTLALGIAGTALATLIATALGWWLYLRRIGHLLEVPTSKVFPWRGYLSIIGVALGAAAVGYAVRWYAVDGLPQGVAMLIAIAVFTTIYAVVGSKTGLIRRSDWSVLLRWLSLRFLRKKRGTS